MALLVRLRTSARRFQTSGSSGRALLQVVEDLLRFLRLAHLQHQVGAHLFQRVAAGELGEHLLQPLIGIRKAVGGDVQLDLGQVVGHVVGCLRQQLPEVVTGIVELADARLRDGQSVARGIQLGIVVEHGAEALAGHPRGFLEEQLGARAHLLVAQAVFLAALGILFGAVAGVGDTRFGDRVGEEELRRLAVVAVLPRQALEHVRHRARIVTGANHVGDADAVGFLLVLPGKAQLVLDRRRLGPGDRRDTRIPCAGGRGDDAGEHRCHHRQLHALLCLDAAGEVALDQVAEFVGQHRGILAFGLGVEQ